MVDDETVEHGAPLVGKGRIVNFGLENNPTINAVKWR